MAATTERCPWCGSTISHEKFVQVQNAIREEERRKLALAEKAMKAQLEKTLFSERKAIAGERAKLAQLATSMKKQLDLAKQQADRQRLKEVAEVRSILGSTSRRVTVLRRMKPGSNPDRITRLSETRGIAGACVAAFSTNAISAIIQHVEFDELELRLIHEAISSRYRTEIDEHWDVLKHDGDRKLLPEIERHVEALRSVARKLGVTLPEIPYRTT